MFALTPHSCLPADLCMQHCYQLIDSTARPLSTLRLRASCLSSTATICLAAAASWCQASHSPLSCLQICAASTVPVCLAAAIWCWPSHPNSLLPAELRIQHCNDLFGGGSSQSLAANGAFSAISCLPLLRRLAIEDLHCRIEKGALSELSSMTQVGQAVLCSLMSGSCCSGDYSVHLAIGYEDLHALWKVCCMTSPAQHR